MQNSHLAREIEDEAVQPPFLYEIRVKGRLSTEQWTSWFDDLVIASRGAESTLRGSALDHAALYGLLARLQDLAIPLVSVKVLDAEAQRALTRRGQRYDLVFNLLLAGIYLLLLGALVAVTTLVTQFINTALLLAWLGVTLGALAHAFGVWSGQNAWRLVSYVAWPLAAVAFLVYIPTSGLLPTALGMAVMLLLLAGLLIYLLFYLRRRAEQIRESLANSVDNES